MPSGQQHPADRDAGQRGSRDEEPADVQCAAIAGDAPGFDATKLMPGLIERAGLTEQQQAISGAEPHLRIGQLVGASLPNRHDVHARRQASGHLGDRRPLAAIGEHDLDGGGRCRRRRQPGGHQPREREDAQNGDDDADRIGHRVSDRGRAVADGIDGGLQRRRTGHRSGEQPERVRGRHVERGSRKQRPGQRAQHPRGAQRVPHQAGATQARKELPPVLDADAVEKHHEADRAHERRRRRHGRDRPERQACKQHPADVERKARDRDPADGVADANRRKQRQHRRVLEERADAVEHGGS